MSKRKRPKGRLCSNKACEWKGKASDAPDDGASCPLCGWLTHKTTRPGSRKIVPGSTFSEQERTSVHVNNL